MKQFLLSVLWSKILVSTLYCLGQLQLLYALYAKCFLRNWRSNVTCYNPAAL